MNTSVIVTHCAEDLHLLGRCLASIRWQLAPGDELIVHSDGGCLPDADLVKGCRKIATGQRRGISAARNTAVQAATGTWIKFVDVDDLLAPFALEAFRKAQISSFIHVVAGDQFVVHNGQVTGYRPADAERIGASIQFVNPLLVSACFIWKKALLEVGGFDERIHFEEDWDLWLKLRRHYGMKCFGTMSAAFCYYTIDDALRAAKQRDHTVDGRDVREHLAVTYGITPQR